MTDTSAASQLNEIESCVTHEHGKRHSLDNASVNGSGLGRLPGEIFDSDQSLKAFVVRKAEQVKDLLPQTAKEKQIDSVNMPDQRDEQGQNHGSGSTDAKCQPRTPPSPTKTIKVDNRDRALEKLLDDSHNKEALLDWLNEGTYHQVNATSEGANSSFRERQGRVSPAPNQNSDHRQDEASFLLFTHSFDNFSETGDYLREKNQTENYELFASPALDGIPRNYYLAAPNIEIALPQLGRSTSECSLLGVSPLKVPQHSNQISLFSTATAIPPPHMTLTNGLVHTPMNSTAHRGGQEPGPTPQFGYSYHWKRGGYPGDSDEQVSNPYYVIRSNHRAFAGCSFVLPCLRQIDSISVNLKRFGPLRQYHRRDPDTRDLVIATRRVETAICVFGGGLNPKRYTRTISIFRLKGSQPSKQQYEQRFHQRYRVNEGEVSWDVEAHPPVEIDSFNGVQSNPGSNQASTKNRDLSKLKDAPYVIMGETPSSKRPKLEVSSPSKKYRCKLCGKPKQNHNCPFRQSLQRNIGVQIFSCVNAYTAQEPGSLAPALSKMNNFVSYNSPGVNDNKTPPSAEDVASHHNAASSQCHPITVTPQSNREAGVGAALHSPQSSLSTHSQEMSPNANSHGSGPSGGGRYVHCAPHQHNPHGTQIRDSGERKRSHTQVLGCHDKPSRHVAFAPSISLRPEHYRAVTRFRSELTASSSSSSSSWAPRSLGVNCGGDPSSSYHYPPVPLTFLERKRLSDTLFYFSKDIPSMTSDCAAVLREAREQDNWDQAVAELLAQVVVGLYCGEGDGQLDGLQQYLLTLGVAS